jgi:hypothetical protein
MSPAARGRYAMGTDITENIVVLPKPERPTSVWLLTISNGVLAAFLIASSLIAEDRGFTAGQAALSGIVGLGVSISAHATWYGYRYGRIVLLALLTFFLGLVIVHSGQTINWAVETQSRGSFFQWAVARALLSTAWLFVNYWFLLGKRARMFFS